MARFIVETKGLHKGAFEVEAVDIFAALSGLFDGVLVSVEAAQPNACPECSDQHAPIIDVDEDKVCRVCGVLR